MEVFVQFILLYIVCKLCRSLSGWYFCPKTIDTTLSRYAVALAVLSLLSFRHDDKCVVGFSDNVNGL